MSKEEKLLEEYKRAFKIFKSMRPFMFIGSDGLNYFMLDYFAKDLSNEDFLLLKKLLNCRKIYDARKVKLK